MPDAEIEFPTDSEVLEDDKTSKENESDLLKGIPDEDEKDSDDSKPDKAEIAQKIKWRNKYETLKSELDSLKSNPAPTSSQKEAIDDKEKQAQEYLRSFFRKELESYESEKSQKESKVVRDFEDKVDAILEDNPDVEEDALLDIVEEFEVEPEVALKILKRQSDTKPKPKMPSPRRASPQSPKEKPDDSSKDMFQIAREVVEDYKDRGK